VHLGDGPLLLAPTAEDRDQELKGLDARIERFACSSPPPTAARAAAGQESGSWRSASARSWPPPAAARAGTFLGAGNIRPLTKELGADADAQKLVDAYDQKVTS